MALSVSGIIEKLLDNANVGKVVTHVGAGLALAVPLLMLINLSSGLSILPADSARELTAARDAAKAAYEEERRALRPLLVTLQPGADGKNVPDTALYGWASREIARLTALIETHDGTLKALMAERPIQRDQIDVALKEKAAIAERLDPLVAQKESVDAASERLRTAENQLADAHSFTGNLEVFTNNISAVLAFAVVLGVVLSQVSRLVFVNLIYDKRIKRSKRTPVAAIKAGTAAKETHDELVRDYYRYVEGCINMIGPTALFGVVFPLYARSRLVGVSNEYLVAISIAAFLSAIALGFGGFYTYREYRKRVNELVDPDFKDPLIEKIKQEVEGGAGV